MLELLGIVSISVGVVLLLRAVSMVRADLVAMLTISPGSPARDDAVRHAQDRVGGSAARRQVRSFEDEVAALNEQLGKGDKGTE